MCVVLRWAWLCYLAAIVSVCGPGPGDSSRLSQCGASWWGVPQWSVSWALYSVWLGLGVRLHAAAFVDGFVVRSL